MYESLERSLGPWAALHGCALTPTADPAAYDPSTNMRCFVHGGCAAGTAVSHCMYDGTHGTWPGQPAADRLIWRFLTNRTLGREHEEITTFIY